MYEQPYNPYQRNIGIVKDYFKTPSVLALAFLNIAAIVTSFVTALVSAEVIRTLAERAVDYYDGIVLQIFGSQTLKDFSQYLHETAGQSSALSMLSSASILSILSIIALFLIYFKSRSSRPDASPHAGVMILYVIAILSLIGCIIMSLLLVAAIALNFYLYSLIKSRTEITFTIPRGNITYSLDTSTLLTIAIACTIAIVIVIFLMLFFNINHLRYIGSVKNSMSSVELSRKGAKPYGVFCVILAVFAGLGCIASIPSLFSGGSGLLSGLGYKKDVTVLRVCSILMQAITCAALVMKAKIALGYAKYIDEKKFGYNEPESSAPYIPAQQTPYSYLAGSKSATPDDDVNPYLDEKKQPTCPACGAPVDENAPFCGQCGSKL